MKANLYVPKPLTDRMLLGLGMNAAWENFFFFICNIYPPFTRKQCIAMFWMVSRTRLEIVLTVSDAFTVKVLQLQDPIVTESTDNKMGNVALLK